MTEKLYYAHPYQRDFSAKVVSCHEDKGGCTVVLDQSLFYPEGGGQPADTGRLGNVNVLDVHERGGVLLHLCDGELEVGMTVTGSIYWAKRFAMMQNHSGEHVVSGIAYERWAYNNVGFHLGSDYMTIDFDGQLDSEDLRYLEDRANECVFANLPVIVSYPSADELSRLSFRQKKALSGEIRLVNVEGYDLCACCGTHVSATGEIGLIKITSAQAYKGGTRLKLLCGSWALRDYQAKSRDAADISAMLSAKAGKLPVAVETLQGELSELRSLVYSMREDQFDAIADATGPGAFICRFVDGLSGDELRRLALKLAEKRVLVCLFSAANGGFKYALASKDKDVRPAAKALNQAFSGKGGGSDKLAQGSITGEQTKIEEYLSKTVPV